MAAQANARRVAASTISPTPAAGCDIEVVRPTVLMFLVNGAELTASPRPAKRVDAREYLGDTGGRTGRHCRRQHR
ncbi:MAG: hypothetical protein R2867_03155 [Caldilineaceae bacterium]